MKKFIRYTMVIAIILVIAIGLYYVACIVRTPEITGIVIDKENKKPVENAWIMAVVETNTRTFGGDVSVHYLITPPHTRTDKTGRFSIPSRTYYSSPPPLGWGMSKIRLRIDVYGPEGKRGAIDIHTYQQAHQPVPQDKEVIIRPSRSLNERRLDVTIPVTHVPMILKDAEEELARLFGYCSHGRYYYAWPVLQGGCTSLENDYLIAAYETFLKAIGEPRKMREEVDRLGALGRLGSLYEGKGDYTKAYEYFISFRDYGTKIGVDTSRHEQSIQRLKEKLKAQQ